MSHWCCYSSCHATSLLGPRRSPNEWVQTEQRFVVLRLRYSRLGDKAADEVDVEAVKPATDVATPGSQEALYRFVDEMRGGTFNGHSDFTGRMEIEKLRTALQGWGAVESVNFTGTG
jgi:hypothetical protein